MAFFPMLLCHVTAVMPLTCSTLPAVIVQRYLSGCSQMQLLNWLVVLLLLLPLLCCVQLGERECQQ
jgi:Fe-S-cluster containining protein